MRSNKALTQCSDPSSAGLVDRVTVPPENKGELQFPYGPKEPGLHELVYFLNGSVFPFVASVQFKCNFEEVKVKVPPAITLGKVVFILSGEKFFILTAFWTLKISAI